MATIVLSAVGAAVGSSLGGSFLGISSAVLGQAVGATLGRVIDQQLLGVGSEAVETGKVDRFRLSGANEGTPVGRLWGRSRLSGQVIWSSRFKEKVTKSGRGGGGKGGGGASRTPEVKEYSYSVSLAIALCEGRIARVGRIWADGNEIEPQSLDMRVYKGSETQQPDPLMEAIQGKGWVPAYRGVAYVVIEDLELSAFGNRVPQFSFEVIRPAQGEADDLAQMVRGVALIPGTGEYSLATTRVNYDYGLGSARTANVNSPCGRTDFETSFEALRGDLPRAKSISLVVSWFAGDLRAPMTGIRPKVEQRKFDGAPMQWRVAGLSRSQADVVPEVDGRIVYGGTPADASVVEAIEEMARHGRDAIFYPFILMDQIEGNLLIDPYSGMAGQPPLPWRGRMTLTYAPGHPFSPDGTKAAETEVASFFGTARPDDFAFNGETVTYSGSDGWSYRRFILHYAHLCKAAGGVAGFCIGSELRGITTIRGEGGSYPAVEHLRALVADVRAILGPRTKIGYAADWSEYFGHHPVDAPGDVYFHLDPLWADSHVDFVGIDNYMPLSDWRDGEIHADAGWGAIYDLGYLRSNIEGGEGYDWYYPSKAARNAQSREPIIDGAYNEPWVWRYKDIRNWWLRPHHDRIGGIRQAGSTAWVPQSKPIWFTELGCPAVDKGSNSPNLFLDPKSSESAVPPYSTGARDDLIQRQYIRAMLTYWDDPAVNPMSDVYGDRMVDLSRAHVWCWDARPFPQFPGNDKLWSDGENYSLGHWLNGRASAQALDAVVREICVTSGLTELDVSKLYGLVRGYRVTEIAGARANLQPLMLAYAADAVEREGRLVFFNRDRRPVSDIDTSRLALTDALKGEVEHVRSPEAEIAGNVRLSFVESDGAYETRAVEAIMPDEESRSVAASELPLVLTGAEGQAIVERWLAEAWVARDSARLALPPSALALGAGDVLRLPGGDFRIDRLTYGAAREIEAVRVERGLYQKPVVAEEPVAQSGYLAPLPVYPLFLDLPLMTGEEVPHAPHVAVAADPWPGSVAVYSAVSDSGYEFNTLLGRVAVLGVTESPMLPADSSRWDRGAALRVRLAAGELVSVGLSELLAGANASAIGDGSPAGWEVFQFREAELVAPLTYDLRVRLRGQAGTEGEAATLWPVGSLFVLLDGAPVQVSLPLAARGLERHYRIGPGARPYDDASYVHRAEAFDGIGLRPYAPCHLRAERTPSGDLTIRWTRRTRLDGDNWASFEVPLGEAREAYHVRVIGAGNTVLRDAIVDGPSWSYSAAAQSADGVQFPFAVEAAQLSDQFGPGPYRRIQFDE